MQFKVREGPWENISEGKFQGHEAEIYLNPEEVLLSIIFETENGKRLGALIQFFKIFSAKGNLEGFVETLPRNVIALNIHSEQQTFKFLILDSGIDYSSLKEEEFQEKTDKLLKKLKKSSEMTQDVAKAYDLELTELKECSNEEKEAFYSMPLVNLIVSPVTERKPIWKESVTGVGEIIVGLTKEGNLVKEPLSLFQRIIVSEGERNARMLLVRVLLESVLLSKTPAIIIDWNGEFSGLSVPTEKIEELKEYKVELEPAGFPLKEFRLMDDLKVNLHAVNAEGMCEVLGLGEGRIRTAIVELIKKNKDAKIIPQLINAAKRSGMQNLSKFEQNKVFRVLNLFEHRYPGMLDGENNVEELAKHWAKSLGRASIISLKELDEREALLLIDSLLNELKNTYSGKKGLNAVIVLPEAERILQRRQKQNKIIEDIQKNLLTLEESGIGYILETTTLNELEQEIEKNALAIAKVVKENDVGIQVKGRKSYRVSIRPSLSKMEAAVSTKAKEEKKEEKKKSGLQFLRL